jgi:hypothetical protein
MKTYRTTAITVGVLFILATVLSVIGSTLIGNIIGSPLSGTATGAPNYLANAAANANQMIVGALLEVGAALSVALISAALFPLLRRRNEGIALGYFGLRIMEALTLLLGAICALLLVTLSQGALNAGAAATPTDQTVGSVLLAGRVWAASLNPLIFGLGALLLYPLLYQSNLIPRWLSAWGLIGAVLVFILGVVGMFGTSVISLAIPIAVQEMVMALWLIVRGFNATAPSPVSPDRPQELGGDRQPHVTSPSAQGAA